MIIEKEVFKLNQRLTLILPEFCPQTQCRSRIEDIAEDSMTIGMPMSKGRPIFVPEQTVLQAKIVENGIAYRFDIRLLAKRISPLPVWVISLPTNIEKVQQRSFVRLDVLLPVDMQVIEKTGQAMEASDAPVIKVTTKNISAGGACLITRMPLRHGAALKLRLELPGEKDLEFSAEVMRVDKVVNDQDLYWIGVEFLEVSETQRKKIIQFIYKRQLEQRQKER